MGWSGQGGSAWIGRGGDPSPVAIPLGDASPPGGEQGIGAMELIDTEITGNFLYSRQLTQCSWMLHVTRLICNINHPKQWCLSAKKIFLPALWL